MRLGAGRTPLPWLGGLLLVYLAVPVLAFCARLAATGHRGFHDPGLFGALATSVVAASLSTAIITCLGVPLAYLLSRSKGRLSTIAGVAVQLPLAVPPVMSGILLIYLVGPYSTLGRFFGGALTESLAGIVLAQTFVAAPFLVVTARAAFGAVDPALEDVASTLGHGAFSRFLRVAVPVAAPGIRAGMVLAWLRAFGEYGATVVLAYHPTSLPVYTFTQFSASGLPGTMAPTALSLGVAVCCVALGRLVVLRIRRRRRVDRTVLAGAVESSRRVSAAPAAPAAPAVSFTLDHRLGGFRLHVAHRGETTRLAVLGPSGSGKSTLLRCLAGIYGAAPGAVRYGERLLAAVPASRRRVGYVAQGFGLFPHLTVWEQVTFSRHADHGAAAAWLERFHLRGLEDRFPSELSGGQRQRVALAQALASGPDVLLLDEPFSALDTPVRDELRRELRRLQRETGISTVVVTHDPEEAALLADEVLVIEGGQVLQEGAVARVYRAPASPAAARLLGVHNAFPAVVTAPGVVVLGGRSVPADTGRLTSGTPVVWSVLPHEIRIDARDTEQDASPVSGRLPGLVDEVVDLGTAVEVTVWIAHGIVLRARVSGVAGGRLAPGDRCTATVPVATVWAAPTEPTAATGDGEARPALTPVSRPPR